MVQNKFGYNMFSDDSLVHLLRDSGLPVLTSLWDFNVYFILQICQEILISNLYVLEVDV